MSLVVQRAVGRTKLAADLVQDRVGILVIRRLPDAQPREQVAVLPQVRPEAMTVAPERVCAPEDLRGQDVGGVGQEQAGRVAQPCHGLVRGVVVQNPVDLFVG